MGTSPAPVVSSEQAAKSPARAALTLAALGVVFGDIGTSPLYALRECFTGTTGLPVTPANVIGSVSLILWLLIIIVSIKYIMFVMRADNKGEGGILSLMALVHRIGPAAKRSPVVLPFVGILGASLLFSDGVITPAISVLSAVEGVAVASPVLSHLVIPIALVIVTGLFLIQSRGTAQIGSLFGPVLMLWFLSIAMIGMIALLKNPLILHALNPINAILLVHALGPKCLILLGAVFLAVTGTEVLYADMGHFGKSPIRRAWFFIVFPSLVINYLGQGAHLLSLGRLPENLFYSLAPQGFLVPLIIIATLATIIASQAVIAGAFSLARQSVQLGFWPRIKIVHTSTSNIGQVYLPFITVVLYALIFLLIVGFKKSGNLASAYGIAVSIDMLITSALILLLSRSLWKAPLYVIIPIATVILLIDCSLLIANLSKFFSGGWIVVVIAAGVVILMTTWIKGRKLLQKTVESESVKFEDFIRSIGSQDIIRPPKTAVFLSGNPNFVPRALLHNFKHNGTIHATNLIVGVKTEEVPVVSGNDRYELTDFGHGIYRILFRYGFMESPDIPRDLAKVPLPISKDPLQYSYFLGKESLVHSKKRGMAFWRKQIFFLMARNSLSAGTFFSLPPNRVVELGVQIEL